MKDGEDMAQQAEGTTYTKAGNLGENLVHSASSMKCGVSEVWGIYIGTRAAKAKKRIIKNASCNMVYTMRFFNMVEKSLRNF